MGHWIFGVIDFWTDAASLTAAAVAEALDIPGFPADARPMAGRLNLGEFFDDGGSASCTAELGDAGDPNALLLALNVFDTTAIGDWTVASAGVQSEDGATGPVEEAAYLPQLLVTADVNVVLLTVGKIAGTIWYVRYDSR